ncbi:hypothetical protein THAOC_29066 [Thalassiosira oceanica]|uniref:Uncharacterized protein n=1 Tax=Thalassiosira oceanica TaxID=159749 RepID=K0RYN4_THAOC|nr:hypothetical protein THAOC_29066 [Thalassiosira oceanica]|eukprot:EJK51737.1 hypothetical protein THAOC_29066 [Thalassiosira oceanica]
MPSRRPAAARKPSFAYFPVDYLPHDVLWPDEPTDFRERYLLDATPYERSEDNGITLRNPRNNAIHLASAEMDSFDRYHLAHETILAVEVGIFVYVVAQLEKESPASNGWTRKQRLGHASTLN